MDGVLAILLIPLLLAGIILVILNMLDVDISLSRSTVEDELSEIDQHKGSTSHTDMLNVSHNSSTGAHTNFDDKYMSSSSVQALIDENNSSSSHRDLIGGIIGEVMDSSFNNLITDSSLNAAVDIHNTSNVAHNLNMYGDLGAKLNQLETALNNHTHTADGIAPAGPTSIFDTPSDYNWTSIAV